MAGNAAEAPPRPVIGTYRLSVPGHPDYLREAP